jgi:outer membrane autotransporter protein
MSAQAQFFSVCNNQNDPSACEQAIAPEEMATLSTTAIEMSDDQIRILRDHIRAVRLGIAALDRPSLDLNIDGLSMRNPFLASYEPEKSSRNESDSLNRLGTFVTSTFGFGHKDATIREDGFDLKSVSIIGGADYRFTSNFILGLAMDYSVMDADLDEEDGEVEVFGYGASLYSTYYVKDFYIDFTASVHFQDYEITRRIRFPGVEKTAIGDTDGVQYNLGLGVGYEFRIAKATFGPYVQMNYLKSDVDGFQEHSADEYNLEIGSWHFESLTTVVGGQASYTMRTGFGDLVPQARVEWWHEFETDTPPIEATGFGDSVAIPTDDQDSDYVILGFGLLVAFSENASLFLEYQTTLGLEDISHHIARAQLGVSF